jgi:hypothetical protein
MKENNKLGTIRGGNLSINEALGEAAAKAAACLTRQYFSCATDLVITR